MVKRMKPTGVYAEDMINLSTAVYNSVYLHDFKDDYAKPFRFFVAWEVMRIQDKFMA